LECAAAKPLGFSQQTLDRSAHYKPALQCGNSACVTRFLVRAAGTFGTVGYCSFQITEEFSLGADDAPQMIGCGTAEEAKMNGLIYLIGLIVVILAILSFFGLR
jgi:hypothetical protein